MHIKSDISGGPHHLREHMQWLIDCMILVDACNQLESET